MYTDSQNSPKQNPREQIKQELRQRIQAALQSAKELPPEACFNLIKAELSALQRRCQQVGKVFIVVEETITCDQYDLGGNHEDMATLFRGPDENASVAICVTDQGSLAYRNSTPWMTYKNQGDICPIDGANKELPVESPIYSSIRTFTKMGV
ncbi:MAG: hypothetical protein IGS54_05900 [Elainella sp. C42_A2020_010]|nr:hypothetical protein [Elainella sp. C42_A2020_010]